jgi:hypothetical protein
MFPRAAPVVGDELERRLAVAKLLEMVLLSLFI